MAQWLKNLPASAGDTGPIPGSGRPPGEGSGNSPCTPAWETPWTGEPGGLQSMGSQRVEHALAAKQQQALLQGILPTGDGTQVSHIAGGVFTI